MTVDAFVDEVFLAATGKTTAPAADKRAKIIQIGNRKLRQFAAEKGVDWQSLYDPAYSAGLVTATDTFALNDAVRKISQNAGDPIRIYHTNGTSYTDYTFTAPSNLKLHPYSNYVSIINARRVKFAFPFKASSTQFGGTIYLPVYLYPTPFEEGDTEIEIDNPDWLVLITAAEYIRNDITRQNQYGNLVAEANDLMESMKADNDSQDNSIDVDWNPIAGGDHTPPTTRLE